MSRRICYSFTITILIARFPFHNARLPEKAYDGTRNAENCHSVPFDSHVVTTIEGQEANSHNFDPKFQSVDAAAPSLELGPQYWSSSPTKGTEYHFGHPTFHMPPWDAMNGYHKTMDVSDDGKRSLAVENLHQKKAEISMDGSSSSNMLTGYDKFFMQGNNEREYGDGDELLRAVSPFLKSKEEETNPQIEDEEEQEEEVFDTSQVELKQFAWINTLRYPNHEILRQDQRTRMNVMDEKIFESEINQIFKDSGFNLPPVIKKFMEFIELKNLCHQMWKNLISEVVYRNKSFLFFLSSVHFKKTNDIDPIRREQENFLKWLLSQHELPKQELGSTPQEVSEAKNPTLQLILSYLETVKEGKDLRRIMWKFEPVLPLQSGQSAFRFIKYIQALQTKASIEIIAHYYKFTNREKWNLLFQNDVDFVKIFIRMKRNEQHRNNGRIWKELEAVFHHPVFPWISPPTWKKLDQIRDLPRWRDRLRKIQIYHNINSLKDLPTS